MAFDGITIAGLVKECREALLGGRIYKIAQPESDELLLTVKGNQGQKRLLISAGASLPLMYLTQENKQSPMTAPSFCMLLRKHLQNGRIIGITQPGLERIVHMDVEHLDEMGDLKRERLTVEIMGKHSNIIFCQEDGTVIDSIKHVSGLVSSVREVLPGRPYFIPNTQDKANPLEADFSHWQSHLEGKPLPLFKAVYSAYTGISPVIAQEICYRAGVDGERSAAALSHDELTRLYEVFREMMEDVKAGRFTPQIAYTRDQPAEFAALRLSMYSSGEDRTQDFDSISQLLETYYAKKNAVTRIRQKSSELRRIVQTALERDIKKYDLQLAQIRDTEKRDKYRIYGELLNTYGYSAAPGSKSLTAVNYYNGETVQIPLDPTLTASENAQRYFERYNKLKRTYEALSQLTQEVKAQIDHLESVSASLDIALQEEDLVQIKEELTASGYIRRKGPARREKVTSRPFRYLSSDGFPIYVGKNNYQNDELTFQFASGGDWWFHAKNIPGSHVIVRCEGGVTPPDSTFEEAARLAAYYSKGRGQDKVEVDYIQKKHVKKPSGAKPGFVVYYTNYSMMIDPDISRIREG